MDRYDVLGEDARTLPLGGRILIRELESRPRGPRMMPYIRLGRYRGIRTYYRLYPKYIECVDRVQGRYQTKPNGNYYSSEPSDDEVLWYSQVKKSSCVATTLCSQA